MVLVTNSDYGTAMQQASKIAVSAVGKSGKDPRSQWLRFRAYQKFMQLSKRQFLHHTRIRIWRSVLFMGYEHVN